MITRRIFLSSAIALPFVSIADDKADKRPRAVVFSASWCGACRRLKRAVTTDGKWPEFNWIFAEKGTATYDEWKKKADDHKYKIHVGKVVPLIWWPDLNKPKTWQLEGYKPNRIDGVVQWMKRNS